MLQALRIGLRKKRTVKMVYQNLQGDIRYRRVDPYKMTDKKLYGYCHLRKQERIFNLENILSAQLTDERYTNRID
jgi:predicted DNA-binding transcriptional regulator YafY